MPKAVEAKDCTGGTENIRVVVAYAESYLWASDLDDLHAFTGPARMRRPLMYVMAMSSAQLSKISCRELAHRQMILRAAV